MSIWPRSTPCRAQVGSAWCRLCQDSPIDRIASHQTLPDLSRDLNGPLADGVADRVDRPGDVVQQRDADQRAPEERGERALPATSTRARRRRRAAAARRATSHGNSRETRTMSRSLSRSGRVLPLRRSARCRTASRCGRSSRPFISAGTRRRRSATASAGRRRGRRTCGACGGRRPSGSPGPRSPSSRRPPARSCTAAVRP